MVAGITHQRVLTTSQQHEWALQPEALEVAMQQDLAQGLIPFYLCATIGEPCEVAASGAGGVSQPAAAALMAGCVAWLHHSGSQQCSS
jgi:aromatic-L-amino-acid decarboxylase